MRYWSSPQSLHFEIRYEVTYISANLKAEKMTESDKQTPCRFWKRKHRSKDGEWGMQNKEENTYRKLGVEIFNLFLIFTSVKINASTCCFLPHFCPPLFLHIATLQFTLFSYPLFLLSPHGIVTLRLILRRQYSVSQRLFCT